MRLEFRLCREMRFRCRPYRAGTQVSLLNHLGRFPDDCWRCGRKAYFWVRESEALVGVCDWHTGDRLPLEVRRSSFSHMRR